MLMQPQGVQKQPHFKDVRGKTKALRLCGEGNSIIEVLKSNSLLNLMSFVLSLELNRLRYPDHSG
jgi:hypothetical protein